MMEEVSSASTLEFPKSRSHPQVNFDDDSDDGDFNESIFFSACFGGGKLGVAFYHTSTLTLSIVNDVIDWGPDFPTLRSIFKQVNPTRVIVNVKHSVDFSNAITQLCQTFQDEELETSTSTGTSNGPQATPKVPTADIVKLTPAHFLYSSCLREILTLRLPPFQDNITDEQQRTTLSGYFDFKSESSVRAAGALIKYLKDLQNRSEENMGCPIVLSIDQFVPADILGVEDSVLKALQVFNPVSQSSASRFGSWNRQREGLSIFNLLNKCKSAEGAKKLNYMCRTLPRDIQVIEDRQSAVAFFSNPVHLEVLKSVQNSLKNIKGLHQILKRIYLNQATVKDWKYLRTTLMHQLRLIEICATQISSNNDISVPIMEKIACKRSSGELCRAYNAIEKTFDEEMSEEKKRYVVLPGVSVNLDEKKRLHNGLPDLMLRVVQEEVEDLPDCMTECSMVYVPHVGYLLAIKPWWEPENEPPILNAFKGLQFLFLSGGVPHFKSERCVELDEKLGDTATDIAELETEIMVKVTNLVLSFVEKILEMSDLCSELDVLTSLSIVTAQYEWVRPRIEEKACSRLYIKEEQLGCSFVPNSTAMGEDKSTSTLENRRVIILTGHNASGKSVYLKQVGLIAFLAHLGCFVPAESAVIPLLHSIHTRIQTTDSVEVGLSSFAVDINQMSGAIRNSRRNSLVLVDEFGKGTCPNDGVALLAATLQSWMESKACPFVIVATHFFQIFKVLPRELTGLGYFRFSYEVHDGVAVQLYKLVEGTIESSKAFQLARVEGIEDKTVERAIEVLNCFQNQSPISPPDDMYDMNFFAEICSKFLNLDFEDADWKLKMEQIFELLDLV